MMLFKHHFSLNGSNEKCAWISILICTPRRCTLMQLVQKKRKKERKKMHNFLGASVVARSF